MDHQEEETIMEALPIITIRALTKITGAATTMAAVRTTKAAICSSISTMGETIASNDMVAGTAICTMVTGVVIIIITVATRVL